MNVKIFYGHPDEVQKQANEFLSEEVEEPFSRNEEGVLVQLPDTMRSKRVHQVIQSESAVTENAEGIEFVKSITLTLFWN